MRWYKHTLLLTACSLVSLSCSVDHGTQPVAGGGDDFPNPAIAAVGTQIADGIDSAAAWRTTFQTPTDIPALAEHDAASAPTALAKRAALLLAAADTTLDTTDIADGILRYCLADIQPGYARYDTIVVRRDTVRDTEPIVAMYGTVTYIGQYRTDRYRYEDFDGDSLLYDSTAAVNHVLVTYRVTAGALTHIYQTVSDPGMDNRFDTGDDLLRAARHSILRDADTVEHHEATDADGDGVLVGGRDSCEVDLNSTIFGDRVLHPLTAWRSLTARFVVFPGDSTKDYCVRFTAGEIRIWGDTVWTAMTGTDGISAAYPGDAARLVQVSTGPPNRPKRDTLAITVLLGPDARDSLDDGLSTVYAHTVDPSQSTGTVDAAFWFENTSSDLTVVESGTFAYWVTNTDGSWARVTGDFDSTGIRATWEDSEGNSLQVTWRRDGTNPVVEEAPRY